jgi:hypothetical protein
VLVSDKGKDGKYRTVFSGQSKDCYLMDLRPNTEYHIRVHALMKSRNLKGGASDTVSFHTKVRFLVCQVFMQFLISFANLQRCGSALI